jgi:hypothetical protein
MDLRKAVSGIAAAGFCLALAAPTDSAGQSAMAEAIKALETAHGVAVMDPWGVIEDAENHGVDVKGLGPEAAFRALLGDYELLFYYPASEVRGAGRLAEVWVFPLGMLDRQSLGPQASRSAADAAGDSASRRAAIIENAVLRDPAAAQEIVLRGLGDRSEKVRAATLAVATGAGFPIPRETLLHMMGADPAEDVRAAAMDALVAGAAADPDALRELVEQAQRDPSPVLQAKGAELGVLLTDAAQGVEPAAEEVIELRQVE